jgi:hypothetical protein
MAHVTSLLTVDDQPTAGNGYQMAGIPDGLGAYTDALGAVHFVSNHELGSTSGVTRAHGQIGAFQSTYTLDPTTLDVSNGADLITAVDYSGTPATAFNRFCSADLATATGLFNTSTGNGYNGNLFLAGEESAGGRAVATDPATGNAKVLTHAGAMGFENLLAADTRTSGATVVVENNDTAGQANVIYIGTKQATGTPFDKAGLTNGALYGYSVAGAPDDATFRTSFGKNSPKPWTLTAAATDPVDAAAKGAIKLDRTEDGAWDPSDPNTFYFVTTGSAAATAEHGRGGLWRLHFADRTNPSLGGDLTLLMDGHEQILSNGGKAIYMADNISIDHHGHIVILEDPGNDAYVARVYAFDIPTGRVAAVATFDPARFTPAQPAFITQDEESSGVIDTESTLGAGTFLFDAQVHTSAGLSNPTAQVERGQYMRLSIPDFQALFNANGTPTPSAPILPVLLLVAGVLGGVVALNRGSRRTLGVPA